MTERARILIEQAKLLSAEEQAEIVEAVTATIDLDDASADHSWKLEIDRRASAIAANDEQLEDFEIALADIRRGS